LDIPWFVALACAWLFRVDQGLRAIYEKVAQDRRRTEVYTPIRAASGQRCWLCIGSAVLVERAGRAQNKPARFCQVSVRAATRKRAGDEAIRNQEFL
jgi:hypothetical protein